MTACQEIIEYSPLAMAITDGPAHILRFVNAAFCTVQGKQAEEMIGRPVSEVISGSGEAEVISLLDRVYGGEKSGLAYHLQHTGSSHILENTSYLVWSQPTSEGHAPSLVIQVTDTGEPNLADEQLERKTKEISALNSEMQEIAEQLVLSGLHHLTVAERDHAIAEALQYSFLWSQPEKTFDGLKLAVFYEAALDEALVGGDFFDAFSLPDKSVVILVGDVTGKGLKAAAHTVEIKFALRAFAQSCTNPAEIIARLNEFICDFHSEDIELSNPLVVLSLVVVDPFTGAFQAASAGAEPPFILRASGAAKEAVVSGLILGIDRDAAYETTHLSLEVGDTLLMTTDGILESRTGRDLFGPARLLEAARIADETGTLRDVGQAVLDAARLHGGGQFRDDVCLLLVRRDHTASAAPD